MSTQEWQLLISGLTLLLTPIASAAVVNIQLRKSHSWWLRQQQWSIREKHYTELLSHLTKYRLSLEDRADYFMEPGSEHNQSLTEGEHFKELALRGYESYQAIRDLIGPASVFLSENAIDALKELVREHWNVARFSSCPADGITSALKLVDAAQTAVLTEARSELARTQIAT